MNKFFKGLLVSCAVLCGSVYAAQGTYESFTNKNVSSKQLALDFQSSLNTATDTKQQCELSLIFSDVLETDDCVMYLEDLRDIQNLVALVEQRGPEEVIDFYSEEEAMLMLLQISVHNEMLESLVSDWPESFK